MQDHDPKIAHLTASKKKFPIGATDIPNHVIFDHLLTDSAFILFTAIIAGHEVGLNLTEIQELLNWTTEKINKSIKNLIDAGYLRWSSTSNDKKTIRMLEYDVYLTPAFRSNELVELSFICVP